MEVAVKNVIYILKILIKFMFTHHENDMNTSLDYCECGGDQLWLD